MLVVQSVAGFVPTLFVWTWPSAYVWAWVGVIAVCGTFSHYCLASAMRYADATIVVPMDFLRVPLTATAGWLAGPRPRKVNPRTVRATKSSGRAHSAASDGLGEFPFC
jgi:drug/metabolite transporter (DMT)-like permease